MDLKQVIVVRKDLKMRRGKEIAQSSHGTAAWLLVLTKRLLKGEKFDLSPEQQEWLFGECRHKKICVYVNSEQELQELHDKALAADLTSHLIVDAGLTEFHGVPTKTCICIGPNFSEEIDKLTGELTLY